MLSTDTRAAAVGSEAADPRRWLVLAAIAASTLTEVLEVSIVNITLPHAQTDPRISGTEQHWVVTAYALAVGGHSCSEK